MFRAKYTVVLRTLMDDPQLKQQLDRALSTYPLYKADEDYDLIPDREALNKRLLNHYKYHEIGFETIGRFLDELEITMTEIMPRYNELLKTVVTMANLPSPFDNVDVVETFKEERTSNSESTSTSGTETNTTDTQSVTSNNNVANDGKQVQSLTPQESIGIPAVDIDQITYADQVNWSKDNSKSNGSTVSDGETAATSDTQTNTTSEGSEVVEHTYTKKGNQGVNTYAHDMNEFRTSIIDVVDQIVNDSRIRELFMLVF